MSLDELARAATTTLMRTTLSGLDPVAMRLDLDRRRTHRRRRVAVAVASLATAASLTGVWWLGADGHARRAQPITPVPNPTISALAANGPIVVSDSRQLYAIDPRNGQGALGLDLPAKAEAYGLAWSSDGTRLLMSSPTGTELWDSRTGARTDPGVCAAACQPAWSPDGTSVVVDVPAGVELVELSTGHRTLVPGTGDRVSPVVWSPDGSRLAYVRESPRNALVVLRRDGSARVEAALDQDLHFFEPAWSPDGSRLVLLALGGPKEVATTHTLVAVLVPVGERSAGPARRLRTLGSCACLGFQPGIGWSPDGQQIAVITFGLAAPGGDGLNVMNADGTGLHLVRPQGWGQPAWRPVPR